MSYLSTVEAAALLKISYKTLLNLLKDEKLSGAIKVNGLWQIPLETVENYKKPSSAPIPTGYLSVPEIAKRLDYSPNWVNNLIRIGTFVGAKKLRGSWIVPSSSIEIYIQSCGVSPDGLLSISEVAEYLSVDESWVRKLILKNVLTDEKVDGIRYIKKEIVDKHQKSISLPEGYMSATQAAKELSYSVNTISSLARKGTFPNAKRKKIAYHHAGWIIPINEVIKYKESLPSPKDYVSISDIAAHLGVNKGCVNRLIRNGIIHKNKNNKKYIFSLEEAKEHIEKQRKQRDFEKSLTPAELFDYKITELEVPYSLKKTLELYHEFTVIKINSSQANEKTIYYQVLKYISTFKRLCCLLTNEIFLLNAEQLELIFQNPEFGIQDKRTFISFLDFCSGKGLCTFSKSYKVTPLPVEEREIYSPEQFSEYYTYVKDVNLHIQQAIQSRDYAVTWLFVLMHVIDAWRPSDIIKLPNVALDVCDIQTFDQLQEQRITLEQAQAVINHIYKRVERMYISKTGALGHFLVNQDMIIPTATVLIIAEIHRRADGDQQLFKVGKRKFVIFDKATYFQPFFNKQPDLIDFQSRKMNRTLLTYFFYSVMEGKENANIAYELSQQVRGHSSKDSTATYIQSINKDGPLNRVSLNLFNRGHFGWLYNHLIHLSMPEAPQLDLEMRTSIIEQFRKEYNPYQLEQLSYFLIRQQNSKESLALRLSTLGEMDLKNMLFKIYKNEMPAKLQNVQCLTYPSCSSPTSTTCLHCEYAIPKIYVLISIRHEIDRLIESIQKTEYPAVRVRDCKLLFQILDLLNQAVQQFGKSQIETFINLTNVKQKIIAIQHLISEEA